MTLIPRWKGTITIPPLPDRKLVVGKNLVIQRLFCGADTTARIYDYPAKGYSLIRTSLESPYRELLFRHKGARRIESDIPTIVAPTISNPDELPAEFRVEWDSLGQLETFADTPEKVNEAWANKFSFRLEDEKTDTPGLRAPQIGALHAISAHFAVGTEFEPATVVLPTGTGKTETMLAAQVYHRPERTLVIVPSDALRSQISGKFLTLGILPDASVVPFEIPRPRVAIISGGIQSAADAQAIIDHANVVVSLPNTLEASNPDAVSTLIAACSTLFVDEAHHITAATWQKIRERFAKKRVIQFTATPFRRDNQRVDGKIIFNYKLGDAQSAGYYRRIALRTVEEYGDQRARDRAIAEEAVRALKEDRGDKKLSHLLMARTNTRARADEVFRIYEEIASQFNPVVVYSGSGRTFDNRQALARLHDESPTGSKIVVCVDMLGEGYDLPNLKIAALHDTHKSLAITLQFIGRFTRKGDPTKIGEATAVANIADEDTEKKLSELYAEGADWDRLIKRLSEERIDEELKLQDVVFGLRESGDLYNHLSLWNLRPKLSAQLFRTKCADWTPTRYAEVLPGGAESWHAFSVNDNVLVAVICRSRRVKWGDYDNIEDTIYDLLILRWDKDTAALFLYASDYDGLRSEKIAEVVTGDSATLVSGTPIFNILNNVELPLVKSLGSSRVGAISFTSYFGPNVTEGLASIEKRESALNNLACLGYEEGERVLWGGTQKRGKIWQVRNGSIAEWIAWTIATWKKVSSQNQEINNIIRDFLKPIKLDRAHPSVPIAVQWGEQAQMRFNDRQFVVFGETEVPVFAITLDVGEPSSDGSIAIKVTSDSLETVYSLEIDQLLSGGYRHRHVSGPLLKFRKGNNDPLPIEEYLQKDPFIIRYADGTSSYNCYHIPANLEAGLFDKHRLEHWDWSGIPLNHESMGKNGDQNTIQYRAFTNVQREYDLIFNDDGAGEAADLVCLKDVDADTIKLCLLHCKGAHGAKVTKDIRNFYVVCGQAQKSIVARHAGIPTLYHDLKRRQERWVSDGATRFLKGDMRKLSYFKEKARRSKLEFEMILVQPGASVASVSEDALRLLATTELYLTKTTQAAFRVILSEKG